MAYYKIMDTMKQMDEYAIKVLEQYILEAEKEMDFYDAVLANVEAGNFSTDFENIGVQSSEPCPEITEDLPNPQPSTAFSNDDTNGSSKENTSSQNKQPDPTRPQRTLRSNLRDPLQISNAENALPSPHEESAALVQVKTERFTNNLPKTTTPSNPEIELQLKKEQIDMPPPSIVPSKRTTRQTKKKQQQDVSESVKVKTESGVRISTKQAKRTGNRDSDVVLMDNIDIIDLNSDEEMTPESRKKARTKVKPKAIKTESVEEVPVRSTRTKTRAMAKKLEEEMQTVDETDKSIINENQKRLRHSPLATEISESPMRKRSKTNLKITPQKVNETITVEKTTNINNETYVASENSNDPNTTVTLQQSKIVLNNKIPTVEDLMTEDEDVDVSTPPKIAVKAIKTKPVFSPYDKCTIKQRVEAFEKLKTDIMMPSNSSNNIQAKVGNGKTEQKRQLSLSAIPRSTRAGFTTPSSNQKLPSMTKSKSALKVSQKEYQERELRRQQKESEALAKKEALLQAQIEDKRKRREERQLKAQQARLAMASEKKRIFESAELAKQEKMKQLAIEREEKLAKKREEAASKQAAAIKKLQEEKNKEKKEKQQKVSTPLYLKKTAPLLPTNNCYDSDESGEESKATQIKIPLWQRSQFANHTALDMVWTKSKMELLCCTKPQTMDLKSIFPTIEPQKLKRTSSAIWNRSAMSNMSTLDEEF